MLRLKNKIFGFFALLIICTTIAFSVHQSRALIVTKIGGVNFVSPSSHSHFSDFESLKRINSKWVAFNPYAFSKAHEPTVKYDYKRSWWGEKMDGIENMVQQAKKEGLKVMLKPHVWVMGQGWCGEYDLDTEEDWKTWESNYQDYIIAYAKIAERNNVELLCIGTEYKIAATKRVAFWKRLIKKVRTVYKGKLIYAANWDNFQNIKFWKELDYIGIDSYFPLSKTKGANKKELNAKWKTIVPVLKKFSENQNKKIIFTEFGYKSVHFSAWNQWEIEGVKSNQNINLAAQENAYETLFQNVWNEPWFAGGFIWKWYPEDVKAGGLENSDYTPQHKPVEKIIRQYYR